MLANDNYLTTLRGITLSQKRKVVNSFVQSGKSRKRHVWNHPQEMYVINLKEGSIQALQLDAIHTMRDYIPILHMRGIALYASRNSILPTAKWVAIDH